MILLRFTKGWRTALVATVILASGGMAGPATPQAQEDRAPAVPIPGLTSVEQAAFDQGQLLFIRNFSPREGLGPIFNQGSCVSCHHHPTVAGNGPGYRSNIRFITDPLHPLGELFQNRSIGGGPTEPLPFNAILSKRRPPSLFGDGLIEAIPEAAIVAHEDPNDADGDGIRGVAARRHGGILRFGSQDQGGNLLEFAASALFLEMGLTSPFPAHGLNVESTDPALAARLRNRIPSPNLTRETVHKLVEFVAFLAPPPRNAETMTLPMVARGEDLFQELACAKCHVPSYRTSGEAFDRQFEDDTMRISSTALLNQEIAPYSDFLLHDLGQTMNDGVVVGALLPGGQSLQQAKPEQYRTPPLWGVRFHEHLLMHDGRANNFEQAILLHGGEAARSRQMFLSQPGDQRQALIEFLKSL